MRFVYPYDLSKLSNFMGMSDGFNESSIEAFELKAENDFNTIKDWLPPSLNSMLDIGCGLGAVDIEIGLRTDVSVINLIDGDGTGGRKMSYAVDTKAWSDRKIAVKFIKANAPGRVVVAYPPEKEYIPAELIISLKSCGHHYPVDVYIPLMLESLYGAKRVILDIRRRTNGIETMEKNGFRVVGKCHETVKCERMVFDL